ncbi:MAG: hypothetical protein LBH01_04825 [Verrucomicrobiales bacterium]|jgi:hypothetical protein|nr:hypothetical protein [Verrucomicrobiales bacterium]
MRKCPRILLGSLLIFCWFSAGLGAAKIESVDDILALQGDEFYRVVGDLCEGNSGVDKNFSADDELKIFSRLMKEKAYVRDGDLLTRFFGLLCRKVDRLETLPLLAREIANLPGDSYGKAFMFQSLFDAKLRLTLREWEKQPPQRAGVPPFSVSADVQLKKYPAELQLAWTEFFLAVNPYRKLMKQYMEQARDDGKIISFELNENKFWTLMVDLVSGERSAKAEEVLPYWRTGMVGTGFDSFSPLKAKATFIALVDEGRLQEAAGVVLTDWQNRGVFYEVEENRGLRARFLQHAGTWNWGSVAVGGLVDAELNDGNYEADKIRHICLEMLVESGGEHEVKLLLALAEQATDRQVTEYIKVLAKFVTPEKKDDWIDPLRQRVMACEDRPANAEPISTGMQTAIVKFICTKADANSDVNVCQAAIWAMQRWRRDDTRETLRELVMQHPSQSIAKEAAQTLKTWWDENVEVPPKSGPVRYRILVNGKLYANREITLLVCENDKSYSQSNEQTDDNGEVKVSRDYFLNRKEPVWGVIFRAKNEGPFFDIPFAVQAPLPRDDGDELLSVDISTKPLELSLGLPRELKEYAGRKITVCANGPDQGKVRRDELQAWRRFSADIAEQVATPALMTEKYHVYIRLPGAQSWNGEVDVSKNNRLKIDFKKGTDVLCRIKTTPDDPWFFPLPELFKDGMKVEDFDADYNSHTKILCGLSPGKYTLRFPSSEEWVKTGRITKEVWPAKDVSFEISEALPMEIDLGEIDLSVK